MTELLLHDRPVPSTYSLLSADENSFTFAFGHALSQSKALCDAFTKEVFGRPFKVDSVRLQEFDRDGGYTDIQLEGAEFCSVLEAKLGWDLPSGRQLRRYVGRLLRAKKKYKRLVVLSECTNEYASHNLRERVRDVPVKPLTWVRVRELVRIAAAKSRGHERFHLSELEPFLEGFPMIRDAKSNLVYVVTLDNAKERWEPLSTRQLLLEKRMYCHAYKKRGWPPHDLYGVPNYLGFRFDGKLQGIYYVKSYESLKSLGDHPPLKQWGNTRKRGWDSPLILYHLDRPILPPREVRTGRLYKNQRVWAAIDLLLSCRTIAVARDKTQARLGNVEE